MYIKLTDAEQKRILENVRKQLIKAKHKEDTHTIMLCHWIPLTMLEIRFGHMLLTFNFGFNQKNDTLTMVTLSFPKEGNIYKKLLVTHDDTREKFVNRLCRLKIDFWPTPNEVKKLENAYYNDAIVQKFTLRKTKPSAHTILNTLKQSNWEMMNDGDKLFLGDDEDLTKLDIPQATTEKLAENFGDYTSKLNLCINHTDLTFLDETSSDPAAIRYRLEDIFMQISFVGVIHSGVKVYNAIVSCSLNYEGFDEKVFIKKLDNLYLSQDKIVDIFSDKCPIGKDINPFVQLSPMLNNTPTTYLSVLYTKC